MVPSSPRPAAVRPHPPFARLAVAHGAAPRGWAPPPAWPPSAQPAMRAHLAAALAALDCVYVALDSWRAQARSAPTALETRLRAVAPLVRRYRCRYHGQPDDAAYASYLRADARDIALLCSVAAQVAFVLEHGWSADGSTPYAILDSLETLCASLLAYYSGRSSRRPRSLPWFYLPMLPAPLRWTALRRHVTTARRDGAALAHTLACVPPAMWRGVPTSLVERLLVHANTAVREAALTHVVPHATAGLPVNVFPDPCTWSGAT